SAEHHRPVPCAEPGRTAGYPDGCAVGIEPQHLEGIVLEVGAAIATRLETEAPELARDIGRRGVELRARGGTTEHRVVSDDADAALDVRGNDRSRTTGGRSLPLRGRCSGEHREEQRQAVSHR